MADNIFAEIYNKILGLFGQADTKGDSKNTAVNRLRLVLMQDRTNLTPEIMHRMRSELIEVLSTYVELDKEALELNFEQEGEQMALMLSIPVVRAKDESEIEASIKQKEAAKEQETSNEATSETEDSIAEGSVDIEENVHDDEVIDGTKSDVDTSENKNDDKSLHSAEVNEKPEEIISVSADLSDVCEDNNEIINSDKATD